jgi:hypothetical protein
MTVEIAFTVPIITPNTPFDVIKQIERGTGFILLWNPVTHELLLDGDLLRITGDDRANVSLAIAAITAMAGRVVEIVHDQHGVLTPFWVRIPAGRSEQTEYFRTFAAALLPEHALIQRCLLLSQGSRPPEEWRLGQQFSFVPLVMDRPYARAVMLMFKEHGLEVQEDLFVERSSS